MAYLSLKADDEREYLCNTANIAFMREVAPGDVVITLQKGTPLLGRPGENRIQDVFHISAGDSRKGVVQDIMEVEISGGVLDLRGQCLLTPLGPARR